MRAGLAGLFLLLLAQTGGIPWKSVADILPEQVLGTHEMSCASGPALESPIRAFALKVEGRGYWMLWMTEQAWIAAYFGETRPEEGTLPERAYFGTWERSEEAIMFVLSKVEPLAPTSNERTQKFCSWLVPQQA